MLVIANGAFKSGSTWLFNIVRSMTGFPGIPEAYQNPGWDDPSIAPEKLWELLARLDYAGQDYLVKNHFEKKRQRDLILAHRDVRVLNIRRDLRDIVVSAFYYQRRKHGYRGDFEAYYWEMGRSIADHVRRYHALWDVPDARVYTSSYEALKSDFQAEVQRIGHFLGLALSPEDAKRIREETSLLALRAKYGETDKPSEERFFRKGAVGQWTEYFDEAMQRDIERIERQGLPYVTRGLLWVGRAVKGTFRS
ncbi:sulfotransferase domain-containing protein [Rhodocaloribacter sp.]